MPVCEHHLFHRGYELREPIEARIHRDRIKVASYPGPYASIRLQPLKSSHFIARRYWNRRIGEFLKGLDLTYYGHSVELAKPPAVVTPPALLFHGTAADNVSSILQQGVLRMRRRFAHFSTDYEWVVQFLSDKPAWTIFAIDALRAHACGVAFRKANNHVWLADSMDPQFLLVHSQGSSSSVGHS